MKYLVTGSSGHLGEALVRVLRDNGEDVSSIDIIDGAFTSHTGSIVDRDFVRERMKGVDAVLHAATLHKPHVATHTRQDFVDVNISGTLNLLEEARAQGVSSFIFTSTTSAFGNALTPPPGAPAAWITEDVAPQPKNIYGVTKLAAENLCELFHRKDGLPCLVLRTSRFFPEDDDNRERRNAYDSDNMKANELLHRRADLEDIVSAHLAAAARAPEIGFDRYIISATSPFQHEDLAGLRTDAPAVLRRYADFDGIYERLGWTMFASIDRVYRNDKARAALGWRPKHDFNTVLARLDAGEPLMSPLAQTVGAKGYHDADFDGVDGPYPVE